MKQEASKVEEKKVTLPEVMQKYGAYFSMELKDGFAHIGFEEDGEMFVKWLNNEGYYEKDDNHTPLSSIERVADFMRAMRDLRLPDYEKKN